MAARPTLRRLLLAGVAALLLGAVAYAAATTCWTQACVWDRETSHPTDMPF
ncbi:MAG: hypothetical protein ABI051_13450 [Vicinamibacterales bacterium]